MVHLAVARKLSQGQEIIVLAIPAKIAKKVIRLAKVRLALQVVAQVRWTLTVLVTSDQVLPLAISAVHSGVVRLTMQ